MEASESVNIFNIIIGSVSALSLFIGIFVLLQVYKIKNQLNLDPSSTIGSTGVEDLDELCKVDDSIKAGIQIVELKNPEAIEEIIKRRESLRSSLEVLSDSKGGA